MKEITQNTASQGLYKLQNTQTPRKTFHMEENERMGGKVPVWRTAKTPTEHIEQQLSFAQNPQDTALNNALSYRGGNAQNLSVHQQEFGFGDLVDMVNPLHHIPVVGHLYREITGDDIKPIGNIIGGAVFGGAAGAADGVINTIVEEETGKDIPGNAMAFALHGEKPSFKQDLQASPQQRLNDISNTVNETGQTDAYTDLPAHLLGFTDVGTKASNIKIERVGIASGRTAGTTTNANTAEHRTHADIATTRLPPREPITQVRLGGLYALSEE